MYGLNRSIVLLKDKTRETLEQPVLTALVVEPQRN